MAGINSNASSGVIKRYVDAQDDKLQTNIDSEASARASADTTLQSNINKEASARLEGDNSLRTDLTAETNERKSADGTLQSNINTEASTRAEQVGSLRTDLTAETNARETADSALRTDVDTVMAGLSTETSERKTADSVLQGNIDAETTARTTKDGELASSIASETTRAKNAESTLTANLNAEVTRAKNAEQANATAISNEASTRETNDNALSARIDANAEDIAALQGRSIRYAVHLDSASPTQAQLTSAYQSASGSTATPEDGTTLVDLNYNKEYTWFESSSTWVDRGSSTITPATNSSYGSVKGQTADGTVKADDGLLSVNGWSTVKNDISANAESISNEVSRATGAENTLQNNIDAEATARTSEDGKLNTAISNEASRAKGAENTLQSNIDKEASARTSADTTLQANIDKKVTANTAITGGTFTKVTVDTKGLVTSGASLSASDIPTIAQSQVSGLTSALNGKQAVSNLVTAWQTSPDNTHYPSEKLVSDSITSEATARSESDATLQANINKKVTANANITAGTNCKITYDAKGLVTAGTSLSASDIPTIPESKVSNLVNDLAGKQAKLTAGDYISIGTDNTISHGSSGAVAGTYGNQGYAPKITIDGFGHITSAEDVSITADVANSLSTAGTVRVNLASSSAPTYTSGGNITPGVTGILPVANGGTGNSSVDTTPTANSKKMVTSGGVASALVGKQDKLTAGENITISGTTISAKDTTYDVATASADGLMSSTDKAKLDGIEAGAQKNTVTGVKGGSETAYRTGNVSISKANIGLGNVDNTADSSKVVKGASEDGSGNVIADSYVASGSASGQTVTLLSKSGNTLATFTTQDSKVSQIWFTTNGWYPVLLKNGTGTGTITSTVIFDNHVAINPSKGELKATKFTGPLTGNVTGNCSGSSGSCTGNAATATTATKLGTATVGSATQPIYLNAGAATATTSTVGGTSKPVYLNAGVMTAISDTVGGVAKPVYLNAGTITACSQTVGSSTGPVYMNAGTITACGSLATSTSPQPQAVAASVGSETTKYARGDHRHPAYLSRHTVTIKSTTLYQMISISASDYVANGRGAHMKIECICTSTVNTKVRHTFTADIMWSGANVECWIPNALPSTNANSGVYQIRCLAPKSDSYGCSVDVRGYDANARIIDLRILESDCPYTVTTAPSTNLYNSSHYNYVQYDTGRQNWFFASNPYAGDCTGRSGSTWDTFWNDRFKIGEATVVGALCALAQDGAVYRLTNKTVKFKLPMIMGRCNNVYATTQTYGTLESNARGIALSELANQGFTVPTYAIGDSLYLQGTLDGGGLYFKSDGVITTSMATKGKTYIMFGKVEYLNSTTAAYYTLTSYGVRAYTTDSINVRNITYIDGIRIALSVNAGSASRPVYFHEGLPASCGNSLAVSVTGNAATATKLKDARNIQTNLASTTAASFNGTANITPGVTGILPVAHGGTGQSNLSNVTVGKATADANGNNISDTYATKSGDLAYSSLTLIPQSDGQGNINISAWSILNGKMKFISVIGNASNSKDRVVYFPDGYSFSNVGYASALTTYDDKGSNLWSYHGRILERTTTYIKFKFQQTKSGGPSVTDSFKYCLTLFGS